MFLLTVNLMIMTRSKRMHSYNFVINNYHNFPFLFLTSKFHKTPIKFRFICCNSRGIARSFNLTLLEYVNRIWSP